MEILRDTFEVALQAREIGLVTIPCHSGTKKPAILWKEWQSKMPALELQREWFRERCNIALITTGLVVFDCEDPASAEVVLRHCGETPHMLRTPGGGIHLGYRKRKGVPVSNRVKIKGLPIDIRTDGGLELIPPSETGKGRYEWLGEGLKPISKLPVGKVRWTRERTRRKVQKQALNGNPTFMEYRASRWLEHVPGAVSGEGGHNATFRVACKLTQYFGLNLPQALVRVSQISEGV